MRYTDDRYHLEVEVVTRGDNLPTDEWTRIQKSLDPLGEAVRAYPRSHLRVNLIKHPQSGAYHVECRLELPGRVLFTGHRDAYLDSAFQCCLRKLLRKVEEYNRNPDRAAVQDAGRLAELENDVVAPEDPEAGPVARAVEAGDYQAFRTALVGYEDWLRLRVGRWLQRYPEAEARLGRDLRIGDLVEEVYLNAFERWPHRPTNVALSGWLDHLLDPSLKAMLGHPDEERENASLARTLRETPLGKP